MHSGEGRRREPVRKVFKKGDEVEEGGEVKEGEAVKEGDEVQEEVKEGEEEEVKGGEAFAECEEWGG